VRVRTRWNYGGRVYAKECTEPGADQSFARESDINTIMARYQKTGMIVNVNKRTPFWGDVTMAPTDLIEAQEILVASKTAFEQLPSMLRAMFNNSPTELLRWLDDPANTEQATKWGLLVAPTTGPGAGKDGEEKKEEAEKVSL